MARHMASSLEFNMGGAIMPNGRLNPCIIKVFGIGGGGCNTVRRKDGMLLQQYLFLFYFLFCLGLWISKRLVQIKKKHGRDKSEQCFCRLFMHSCLGGGCCDDRARLKTFDLWFFAALILFALSVHPSDDPHDSLGGD